MHKYNASYLSNFTAIKPIIFLSFALACLAGTSLFASEQVKKSDHKPGMFHHHKVESLNQLKSYLPIKYQGQKVSPERIALLEQHCQRNSFSNEPHCLEKKYMEGDLYKVRISFYKESHFPSQPSAPFIKRENGVMYWDTRQQEAFFAKWSEAVSKEYLGEDYRRFHKVEMKGMNKRFVGFDLLVSDLDNLNELIDDPRIVNFIHIGSPEQPLEEFQ